MTIQEALNWCKDNCVSISFQTHPGQSLVRVQRSDSEYVEDDDFLHAVTRLQQLIARNHKKKRNIDDTPLETLTFEGRNCRGRLLRVARAIRAETVGELLEWAKAQPRGLEKITSYRNIGEQSLVSLVNALNEHGITEIPGTSHLQLDGSNNNKMAA